MTLQEPTRWTNFPWAPARWPFFYGWVIVVAATVATISSIPGQTMGVGVFTDSLMEALGLSREELARAYLIGTVASGSLLPFAGKLLDRIGCRAMLVVASLGLAGSLVYMTLETYLLRFVSGDGILGALMIASIGFWAIRFFGQGCLTLVARVAMGKWFNHWRGFAVAVSSIFVIFGFNSSPKFLNTIVEQYGWKESYLILAGIVGIGTTLIGWFLFRDNPEQCMLKMDGELPPPKKDRSATIPEVRKQFTRLDAMKTLPFWVINFALGSQALVMTAATFHISQIGAELGLNRDQSYAVFIPMAFVGVAANFAGGWISDRVRLKWLLKATLILQGCALGGMAFFHVSAGYWTLIIGYGASGALFGLLLGVAWPRFYGREHLGSISGLTTSIIVWASALGPWVYSMLKEKYLGTYQNVNLVFILLPAMLLVGSFWVTNPQVRLAEEEERMLQKGSESD